jgi:hypothetical protein
VEFGRRGPHGTERKSYRNPPGLPDARRDLDLVVYKDADHGLTETFESLEIAGIAIRRSTGLIANWIWSLRMRLNALVLQLRDRFRAVATSAGTTRNRLDDRIPGRGRLARISKNN